MVRINLGIFKLALECPVCLRLPELLVNEAKVSVAAGGALYLCKLKPVVHEFLDRGGFLELVGRDRVFDTKGEAIRAIYARLDAERCRTCTARIFNECQTVLPDGSRRIA